MSVGKEFFDNMTKAFDDKAEADREEREAKSWDPEEGDMIQGVFLKVQYIDTQYGVKPLAVFRDVRTNESVKVWLSSAVMQTIVDYAPAPGTPIGIRYEGWTKPVSDKGRDYKSYTIVMAEGRTPEQIKAGYQHWEEARQSLRDQGVRDDHDEIVATRAEDLSPF